MRLRNIPRAEGVIQLHRAVIKMCIRDSVDKKRQYPDGIRQTTLVCHLVRRT